jgi:glycine/D-amino acid oxidase-like deaminating enzyme
MACHVNVIGAGIAGLSVAQALKKKYGEGVEVTITADKFYDQTTSYAAGGLWEVRSICYEIESKKSLRVCYNLLLFLFNTPDIRLSVNFPRV